MKFVAKVFYPNGMRYPFTAETFEEAVDLIGEAPDIQAELFEVEEFVEGSPSMTKLADVVNGEWFLTDRRLDMAKVKEALVKGGKKPAKGDDDFLGDGKGKKSEKNASKKAAKAEGGGTRMVQADIPDTKRIKIVNAKEPREGTKSGEAYKLIAKAATIKDLKKMRAKKLGTEDLGGVFMKMLKDGDVKLV